MFRTKSLYRLRNGVWIFLEEITRITPLVERQDVSMCLHFGENYVYVQGFSSREEVIAACDDLAARVNATKGRELKTLIATKGRELKTLIATKGRELIAYWKALVAAKVARDAAVEQARRACREARIRQFAAHNTKLDEILAALDATCCTTIAEADRAYREAVTKIKAARKSGHDRDRK